MNGKNKMSPFISLAFNLYFTFIGQTVKKYSDADNHLVVISDALQNKESLIISTYVSDPWGPMPKVLKNL